MQKPEFGPVNRQIRWTDARVAYVRHLAETENKSAAQIAVAIGLTEHATARISAVCSRFSISLNGQAGRRPTGAAQVYRVGIGEKNTGVLARLARKHTLYPGKIAELLLNAVFEQGDAFCENMLDLGDNVGS